MCVNVYACVSVCVYVCVFASACVYFRVGLQQEIKKAELRREKVQREGEPEAERGT